VQYVPKNRLGNNCMPKHYRIQNSTMEQNIKKVKMKSSNCSCHYETELSASDTTDIKIITCRRIGDSR